MRALGNFLWFILGGWAVGLIWYLFGLLMIITIIGIPWAKACFTLGSFAFFPFGKEAVSRKLLKGEDDIGTGALGVLGNIIWFILCGFWLALGHAVNGVSCCMTLIFIPFGIQHFKFAGLALAPIGKTVVSKEMARELRLEAARSSISVYRGSDSSPTAPRQSSGPGQVAAVAPQASGPGQAVSRAVAPEMSVATTEAVAPVQMPQAPTVPSPQARERFVLQGVSGEYVGQQIPLGPNPLIIGRNPSISNLVVSSGIVSGRHCQVQASGGVVCVTDLGSTNGTFINHRRLPPNMLQTARNGDTVRLADAVELKILFLG